MEELLKDNMYVIDLGNVNTASEIIYELSSVLDTEEAKNKRICLKLGNVELNQAQLLSIKSLISGIDSTLSSLDTKSVATEKVALSLGIIISNVSEENTLEVAPAMPYKKIEEFKEEMQNFQKEDEEVKKAENENFPEHQEEQTPAQTQILPETQTQVKSLTEEAQAETKSENDISKAETDSGNKNENNYTEAGYHQIPDTQDEVRNVEIQPEEEHITEEISDIQSTAENEEEDKIKESADAQETENEQNNSVPQSEEIQDELDVIFGPDPVQTSIFEMKDTAEEHYKEREKLNDIIVPKQEYTKEDIELEEFPTKYIKQTIRSGQVINYDGNIVIIGDCHPGSEIVALGDITVWGVLSGIAHAGSGGNQKARVRALKMNAIQLRIANCYSRRPDSMNTIYIEKTDSFTPEEARIVNFEIVVFKIND